MEINTVKLELSKYLIRTLGFKFAKKKAISDFCKENKSDSLRFIFSYEEEMTGEEDILVPIEYLTKNGGRIELVNGEECLIIPSKL